MEYKKILISNDKKEKEIEEIDYNNISFLSERISEIDEDLLWNL